MKGEGAMSEKAPRMSKEDFKGGYALIRTGNDDRWLLVKVDDDEADARRNPVSTEPKSVLSGQTLEHIAEKSGG
jgi:hypothetical protein